MSRTCHPGCLVGRETLRTRDPAAAGERFRFDRIGGNRVPAAQPSEGAGAGEKRMGGGGGRASAEILRAHAGGKKACPGYGRDLEAILVEHEQIAGSAGEGK